jgi:hypothetical protein
MALESFAVMQLGDLVYVQLCFTCISSFEILNLLDRHSNRVNKKWKTGGYNNRK